MWRRRQRDIEPSAGAGAPAAGRLRARGYRPLPAAEPATAGVLSGLARAVVAPVPGDPTPTAADLTDGLRLLAATVTSPRGPEQTSAAETMLVTAARTGAASREPLTWTEIAAALGEDLAVTLARWPQLTADPRTGPTTPAETAALGRGW